MLCGRAGPKTIGLDKLRDHGGQEKRDGIRTGLSTTVRGGHQGDPRVQTKVEGMSEVE